VGSCILSRLVVGSIGVKPNAMWARNDFEDGFDTYKIGKSLPLV